MSLRETCLEALVGAEESILGPRGLRLKRISVRSVLKAIGPHLDAADAEIARLRDIVDARPSITVPTGMHFELVRDDWSANRDRAIAEAALLREALQSVRDWDVREMAVEHVGLHPDIGKQVIYALGSAPLAEAAQRVIAAADEWRRLSTRHADWTADSPAVGLRLRDAVDAFRALMEPKP